MYDLLLVDDEPSVVDALSLRIPWEELNINQVHKAYSSKEALDLFTSENIDLVVSDIRMPGMDGLTLVSKIKQIKNRTKCVLLTGYADFEYAKQAIQAQASEYLVKPVKNEELIRTIRRLITQLAEEWNTISSYQQAKYTLKENLPLLRNNLLNDLLQGRRLNRALLAEKFELLEIPFGTADSFGMLCIRTEQEFFQYGQNDMQLFEYAILNMADELLSPDFYLWYGKDRHEYLILLISPRTLTSKDEQPIHQILEMRATELQHKVNLYLKGDITILSTPLGRFPDEVPQVYEMLHQELRKIIRGKTGFFKTVEISKEHINIRYLQKLYEPPTMMQLLEVGRWDDARSKIEQIFEELTDKWSDSIEHMNEVYYSILSAFHYIAHKSGKQLMEIAGLNNMELEMGRRRSLANFKQWSLRILENVEQRIEEENQNTNTKIIKQVQLYIEENLSGDVSLQAIADHVYLNPGYLSKLYKMETGENLSEFLYRLRMDKSAFYLKNTNMKIQDICEKLGYQNTSYFIKMFKKHFQVTPQEYRNNL